MLIQQQNNLQTIIIPKRDQMILGGHKSQMEYLLKKSTAFHTVQVHIIPVHYAI